VEKSLLAPEVLMNSDPFMLIKINRKLQSHRFIIHTM
jgi:hypothetical protein